jgi:hypothetical protein
VDVAGHQWRCVNAVLSCLTITIGCVLVQRGRGCSCQPGHASLYRPALALMATSGELGFRELGFADLHTLPFCLAGRCRRLAACSA